MSCVTLMVSHMDSKMDYGIARKGHWGNQMDESKTMHHNEGNGLICLPTDTTGWHLSLVCLPFAFQNNKLLIFQHINLLILSVKRHTS